MAKKKQKPVTFTEQLRAAILGADMTRYRIAKETELTEAGLSRFVNGKSGLSMDSIDKVCDCLGLELVARKTKKGR